MKSYLVSGALVLMGSTLIGCGGGGGGGGSLAGGGISGTGSGTITAFGSIFLNGTGHFQTESSEVEIDDVVHSINDLDLGMVAEVDVSNGDDTFTTGDADRIRIVHEIKGPITDITNLAVLGQPLVLNASTLIENDSGIAVTLGSLALNDLVEISGRRDDAGIIQVSRIERKTSLNQWQLIGRISTLDTAASTFNIGSQSVDYSGATVEDCDSGLSDSIRVKVKAANAFVDGDVLSATEVECKPDRLNFGGSATGSLLAEMEGFVTATSLTNFASSGVGSFTLGDQQVSISSSTAFEGGTVEDIVAGVKLDARGSYDLATQVLEANRIRFRQSRFRIEAPASAFTSSSISVLGLTVTANVATEDDENLLDGGSFPQIDVRGYVDSDGSLIADEIKEEDETADLTDVRVRARISSGSVTGNAANFTFELFNGQLVIDGASAVEFKISDVLVSRETFFTALEDNLEVDVDRATFSGGMLRNGKLEIDDD